MIACGVFTGILFSRKPCGQPGTVHCGHCKIPLCKVHLRPQSSGPFLCPNCDAYERDDDWRYSSRDDRWRYSSSSSSSNSPAPSVAGASAAGGAAAAGAAAAGDFSDEDKAGFNAAGGWHGTAPTDDVADASASDDAGADEGSDFDAS